MFRKRRRPTPNFKIPPPVNPVDGGFASLGIQRILPYCAMMQIAADDEYDDYVICRGFDTRILRFVDYESGDRNKPGISVAKPFGCRTAGKYSIGEVYPAFLPIQGTAVYTPPSPSSVNWRVGQNPGVVDGDSNAGHPIDLSSSIELLFDHNGVAVNWIFIHAGSEGLFRFHSFEDWDEGTAEAIVKEMDGSFVANETIYDPDRIFEGMLAGTKGLVYYQGGKYYIIQAKCDPDEIPAM